MSGRARIEVKGVSAELVVQRLDGVERMGAPWSFDLACALAVPPADRDALLDPMVGAEATIELDGQGESVRSWTGIVDEVSLQDETLRLRVVHASAIAASAVDYRILVQIDAVSAAKLALEAHDLEVDPRIARTPEQLPHRHQSFESDLDFASRILADEGIAWCCDPAGTSKVVFADNAGAYDKSAPEKLVVVEAGGMTTGDAIFDVVVAERAATDVFALRDFDFEKPSTDMTAKAETGDKKLERYEYPGGYVDPGLGKTLAQIRLDEARADRRVLDARTRCIGLAPGLVSSIDGAPGADAAQPWLVTEVVHRFDDASPGAADTRYEARFQAVPGDLPHRPPRQPAVDVGGLQTLDITGAGGAEIHPDKYGRVRAHYRWDRVRPQDDTASEWMRTLQPATSGGFQQPRVGWETLFAFYQGSPDAPLELGRLYRATDPPPEGQPGNKIKTAFGSRTTPGGGSANNVVLDSSAGSEHMTLVASKDFNELVDNDRSVAITADDKLDVGGKRDVTIGKVHKETIGGAQTYTVSANRSANVTANKVIDAGSETVMIGGARIFDIGGDQQTQTSAIFRLVGGAKAQALIEQQSVLVSGAGTVLIGGSLGQKHGLKHEVQVGGLLREQVGAVKSIAAKGISISSKAAFKETYAARLVEAKGDVKDAYQGAGKWKVGGAAHMKGADVVFKAKSKIVINAGGAKITITSSSITIDANIDSSQKSKDKNDEAYG